MSPLRNVLTPDALTMLQMIAASGSFAQAARQMGLVPSALSYRVRQMEEALDVLLFDRSARQAKLTEAGAELLRGAEVLLAEMDAMANRVKRVATGWEPQLTIAVDSILSKSVVLEMCQHFLAQDPPTRIKLRDETLSGTLEALTSGLADLALGVVDVGQHHNNINTKPLREVSMVYAVAPHHPLAQAAEPLPDSLLRQHRAVAVADTTRAGTSMSYGLLGGQDVLTVATMQDKIIAQALGLGGGFVPTCMAHLHITEGRLVVKAVERAPRVARIHYAWRAAPRGRVGRALQWWLKQLELVSARNALLQPCSQEPIYRRVECTPYTTPGDAS